MTGSGPVELGVVMRPGGFIRRPAARDKKVEAVLAEGLDTKALSTKIFIKGLVVETEIGVYAHEKGAKRSLILDIEVQVGLEVRSITDELAQTVDYDSLVDHIRAVAGADHLHLIETFAEQVCARVLTNPRISSVKLRVEKPGSVLGAICSGVEIERVR